MNKFSEIPIKNTKYSLIIIHDDSWGQDGISPEMVVDSGIEDDIHYIIIQKDVSHVPKDMVCIDDSIPKVGEEVWVWDNEYPSCDPIIDERINSPELEWKISYSVSHWKPKQEEDE